MSRRLPNSIAAAAAEADQFEKQLTASAEPAPAPAADDPAPPADPAPAPTPAPADPQLEHKYRTLQGIHSSQVQQMQKQREEIDRLKAELQRVQAPAAPDANAVAANIAQLRTQLGEEIAVHLDTRIRHIVDDAIRAHINPMRDMLSNSADRESERLEDMFFDRMDILVPDWEQINVDPGFIAWLANFDPASGQPLRALLADAQAKLDAERAAVFFRTYARDVATKRRPEPAPAPAATRAEVPRPAQPKVIRVGEIEKFYADQRAGKYRGKESEALAIELEIMNAQREGRVVD